MGFKARKKRNLEPVVLGSARWSFADADDIALFPDRKRIAVVGTGGAVRVFSSKGDVIAAWDIPVSVLCQRVAVSPDGDSIVVGSTIQGKGPIVIVFSLKSGLRRDLKGHKGSSNPEIAINSKGTQVLTGDDDGTLRIWDLSTGKRVASWGLCKPYTIGAVAMTPCGNALFAQYGSGVLRFDRTTKQESRFEGVNHCIAQSADGAYLAGTSYRTAAIKVWDLATDRVLHDLVPADGSSAQVNRLSFCPDGRLLAAYQDGNLRLWDVEQSRLLRTFVGHTASASAVDVSADGTLAVSAGDDSTIRLWELSTGHELTNAERLSGKVCAVAPANGGVLAVHAGNISTIAHWPEIESDAPIVLAREDKGLVTSAMIAADGSRVVLVTTDSLIEYHLASAKWARHEIVRQLIAAVTSDDDSKQLVSKSELAWLTGVAHGRTIKLTDSDGHLRAVLGFSHDNKQVVSAGYYQGGLKLWDADSGSQVRAWKKAPRFMTTVALAQDGTHFLTGGFRGFDLWSVAKAKPVARAKTASVLQGLVGDDGAAYFLSDDGAICKWDMDGQTVVASTLVNGEPTCFAVADKQIIIGHADTTLSVTALGHARELQAS